MALTQQQKNELKKKYFTGAVTTTPSVSDRVAEKKRLLGMTDETTTETPVEQPEQSMISRIGESLKSRAKDIKSSFSRAANFEQTPVETGIQTVGTAAGAVFDVGFEAAKKVLDVIDFTDTGEKILGKAGTSFANSDIGKKALEAVSKGVEFYSDWAKQNPRAAANLEGLGNIASIVPVGKGTQIGVKATEKAAQTAVKTGEKVLGGVAEKIPTIGLKKIESKIAPKVTSKEVSRALAEGRVVRTQNKLFKVLGVPDKIQAEKSVKEAAQVIKDRIPNATRLSDQEIATVSKKQIANISKELEPKLKMLKIDDTPKENILNSWADIKTKQINENVLLSDNELSKAQAQFERALERVIESDNADDIWKSIQKYDDMVGDNIKQAVPKKSSEKALELKSMWLDNRRILRNSLDDISVIIGDDTVKKSFKDMTSLYTAYNNIVANAKFSKGNNLLKKILLGTAGVEILGSLID